MILGSLESTPALGDGRPMALIGDAPELVDLAGHRRRRRRHRRHHRHLGRAGASQRARFKRAAKHCKGRSLRAFHSCMREQLRK